MKKILLVLGISVLGISLLAAGCESVQQQAVKEEHRVEKICGEGNVRQTDFLDGSSKFNCTDYSKVK